MIFLLLCLQDLQAGTSVVDCTPPALPVVVNGMFTERSTAKVVDRLEVRALALANGGVPVVLAVVDSCMVPRDLIDAAKSTSGVPAERILVSSTHTHSAPAAMGCLGSDADPGYPDFLRGRIAEAVRKAVDALRPARAGWTAVALPAHTHTRRWILRGDRVRKDPFGEPTVRAMMHPGYQNADFIGPSGPSDPEMVLMSVRTVDGAPLAVFASYGMHYFGSEPLSADYFGAWRREVEKAVGGVALLAQGTSGDQMWMDYASPKKSVSLQDYAAGLAAPAVEALEGVKHESRVALDVRETRLRLGRRTPDPKRLEWARNVVDGLQGRKPRSQPEIYAREAILLHEAPEVELKLQAIRIGDGTIAAWPNEVFALSGLKVKAASPLRTMNVTLANGAEGYIPPPEQHALGGYTAWPARTAGLEVGAEPRIVEELIALLEGVAGAPRRAAIEPESGYAKAVAASKPTAYWRLAEMAGPRMRDASGNGRDAAIEGGVALHLEGPGPGSRSLQLAGGRLKADVELPEAWTAELWFWNGNGGALIGGLGLDGEGRLALGGARGTSITPPRTWRHLAVVREGARVRAWLDGAADLDVSEGLRFELGSFEGRLSELAVYARALSPEELRSHLQAR